MIIRITNVLPYSYFGKKKKKQKQKNKEYKCMYILINSLFEIIA